MNEHSSESAVSLVGLVKRFRGFVLGPIDLEIQPGSVLGLIGSNGAGKTTLINTIVGLLKHNEGTIRIFGQETDQNVRDWKYDIGYVGDEHVFYEDWSCKRNLNTFAQFYPAWSHEWAIELAERFQLELNKKARYLSKGNRAKLALVIALAYSPRLLLLDEPSSGLDPVIRTEFFDVLYEINKKGDTATFYSTHILSDIDRLADELVFIKDGNFIVREEIDSLTDIWRKFSFELTCEFTHCDSITAHRKKDNTYLIMSFNTEQTMAHLKRIGASNIEESLMSIEEIAVEILKFK